MQVELDIDLGSLGVGWMREWTSQIKGNARRLKILILPVNYQFMISLLYSSSHPPRWLFPTFSFSCRLLILCPCSPWASAFHSLLKTLPRSILRESFQVPNPNALLHPAPISASLLGALGTLSTCALTPFLSPLERGPPAMSLSSAFPL